MSFASRRRWLPFLTGVGLVAACYAARLACNADELHAWFLGRPLGTECAFRARFGIPCPNCGLTRATILALHGEWLRAWRAAPAGPALVLATLACAAALIALGIVRMRGSVRPVAWADRAAPRFVYACAGLLLLVWFGGWIASVAHALTAR